MIGYVALCNGGYHGNFAVFPDGKRIAVANGCGKPVVRPIYYKDDEEGEVGGPERGAGEREEQGREGEEERVQHVAIMPDGNWILTGGSSQDIVLWSSMDDTCRRIPTAPNEGRPQPDVKAIAISPDGERFVVLFDNNEVHIWCDKEEKWLFASVFHDTPCHSISVSPCSRYVVAVAGSSIHVLHMDPIKCKFRTRTNGVVGAAVIAPDGMHLIGSQLLGPITTWSIETGKAVCDFESSYGTIGQLMITPDGHHVAAFNGESLQIWSVPSGNMVFRLCTEGLASSVSCSAITRDGRYIIANCDYFGLCVWESYLGCARRELDDIDRMIGSLKEQEDYETEDGGYTSPSLVEMTARCFLRESALVTCGQYLW